MSKVKYPKLKDLYGIQVSVSQWVPDDKIILIGREEYKDAMHFTRQLSVLDLKTGKVSGSVHEGEVQCIKVSPKNYDKFKEQP